MLLLNFFMSAHADDIKHEQEQEQHLAEESLRDVTFENPHLLGVVVCFGGGFTGVKYFLRRRVEIW